VGRDAGLVAGGGGQVRHVLVGGGGQLQLLVVLVLLNCCQILEHHLPDRSISRYISSCFLRLLLPDACSPLPPAKQA